MAKPEIIGSARSTYTRVVRMVCEEKGIDYTLKETTPGVLLRSRTASELGLFIPQHRTSGDRNGMPISWALGEGPRLGAGPS